VLALESELLFVRGAVAAMTGARSVEPLKVLKFAHRHNPDGTWDSICPCCFQTIATVRDEAKLLPIEREHVCEPHVLERFAKPNGR